MKAINYFLLIVVISFFSFGNIFSQTATFSYTGGTQSWVVPVCVTSISVNVRGAKGGCTGGNGAEITGNVAVTPGQTLTIEVGGAGATASGGYNGGGAGQFAWGAGNASCGGGGGSSIIGSGVQVIAAGGGGMSGGDSDAPGGAGGCATGSAGTNSWGGGGGGGTQSAGGAGGYPWPGSNWGGNGSLGMGGAGGVETYYYTGPGGGGGGGYYGGGGGGADKWPQPPLGGGGGGGGSSFTPVGCTCTAGSNAGNGSVSITYVSSGSTQASSATASPSVICAGDATTLSVVGGNLETGADWFWYSGGCPGTLVGNGASINVTPGSTTTYFVRAQGSCNTTLCVSVQVTVKDLSVVPTSVTATPASTCGGSTTLSVVGGSLGTGATWNWYSGTCGGVPEGTGASIVVSPTSNTTYFVQAAGDCNTTACVSVAVTVNAVPFAIATPAAQTICSGTVTAIALTSFTPGTTFAWTVFQTGVSGGTNNSGSTIAETLTTSGGVQGTAVYTITPTANGCIGNPINVTITVDPSPVTTATPISQTICAGTMLPVFLTSNVSGSLFTWTVVETGVVGGTNGSGTSISDSLSPTGGSSGTAVYTVNSTSSGCPAVPVIITITVNPDPGSTATATPSLSTICSGTVTSIALSSFASGTVFSWAVTQAGGVSGGSSGTGPTISQTLTTGISSGTATYLVALTANGCTGNPITVVVTVDPTPVGAATPTSQTFCSGDSTSIALSSNVPGTTYLYTVFLSGVTGGTFGSDSVINQTLINSGTTSGTAVYSVVPSVGGCSGSPVSVTITVNPIEDAAFVYSSATYCQSGTDPTPIITGLAGGSFSATPSGLSVDPATGTITLATSAVGPYNLCYSTLGTCAGTNCITMTIDNSTPFAGFTYAGSPFCQNGTNPLPIFGTGASAGVFSVTPIGLAFVSINTGEIDLAASAPGTYTITNNVPQSGPCGQVSASTTVVIIVSDDASFVYSSATYCTTGSPQTPIVTGLSGGTFSSTPSGLSLNPTTGTITLTASYFGIYMLSYTTNGVCPSTSSITMTIDTITPSASFSYVGSPFCQNGNNPFPLFGTNASAGVFSATPSGLAFVQVNTGEIDLLASIAGTYIVTNTIPASGICLPISDTYTITIGPSDDASFNYPSATYCTTGPDQTPSITGLTGGTFSSVPPGLSLNPTTGTIMLSSTAVGTYTLTYTTFGSCPNSSSIIMTIADSTPFSNFSYSAASFCQNSNNQFPTFGLNASAGVFSSSPAGLVIVNVNTGELDLSASLSGTYTVTNTIPPSGICMATSSTTTVIVNPSDDAAFTYPSATYCTTGPPQNPTITGLSGGTFSSLPPGLSIDPLTGIITLSNSLVGIYTLSYSTFGTCPSSSSITMTINDTVSSASFTYVGSPFCQAVGANPFPTFAIGASAGTFSASPSGIVFVNVNTGEIDLAASLPGVYTVTNFIPQSGVCSNVSATYSINIISSPVVTATPPSQFFCGSGTAPVSIALSSDIAGTTFSWTISQSGLIGGSPDSGSTISQTLINSGNNTGTATYTITPDANGCAGLPIEVIITVNPVIMDTTAMIITADNCGSATGAITGIVMTSGQSPFTYQWNDSLNAPVGDGNLDLVNVGAGNYTLTITDGNNCSFVVGPFTVISSQAVVAAFTPNPTIGETPLTVNFTNNSTGAASYLWDFGTGDTSIVDNPTYVYTPLGTFFVCLTAISAYNCVDSVCSTIDIYINSVFVIPNVFTPNGDDLNDLFTVKAVGLKTLDAEIFNRWGQKEYEWHTTNGGWDGRTASGLIAPSGTYYFIIKAEGMDGEKYFEKGSFSLIREK